ncbi:MAG: hypothetical protein JWM80_2252 [Cyanobacteria bacterium RYN_339]|nr:hypothetical protein [Cyanobacteria bacterium RYN_339]
MQHRGIYARIAFPDPPELPTMDGYPIPCPKCGQRFRVSGEAIVANDRAECQNRSCGHRFAPQGTSAGQSALRTLRATAQAKDFEARRKREGEIRKNAATPRKPTDEQP